MWSKLNLYTLCISDEKIIESVHGFKIILHEYGGVNGTRAFSVGALVRWFQTEKMEDWILIWLWLLSPNGVNFDY